MPVWRGAGFILAWIKARCEAVSSCHDESPLHTQLLMGADSHPSCTPHPTLIRVSFLAPT